MLSPPAPLIPPPPGDRRRRGPHGHEEPLPPPLPAIPPPLGAKRGRGPHGSSRSEDRSLLPPVPPTTAAPSSRPSEPSAPSHTRESGRQPPPRPAAATVVQEKSGSGSGSEAKAAARAAKPITKRSPVPTDEADLSKLYDKLHEHEASIEAFKRIIAEREAKERRVKAKAKASGGGSGGESSGQQGAVASDAAAGKQLSPPQLDESSTEQLAKTLQAQPAEEDAGAEDGELLDDDAPQTAPSAFAAPESQASMALPPPPAADGPVSELALPPPPAQTTSRAASMLADASLSGSYDALPPPPFIVEPIHRDGAAGASPVHGHRTSRYSDGDRTTAARRLPHPAAAQDASVHHRDQKHPARRGDRERGMDREWPGADRGWSAAVGRSPLRRGSSPYRSSRSPKGWSTSPRRRWSRSPMRRSDSPGARGLPSPPRRHSSDRGTGAAPAAALPSASDNARSVAEGFLAQAEAATRRMAGGAASFLPQPPPLPDAAPTPAAQALPQPPATTDAPAAAGVVGPSPPGSTGAGGSNEAEDMRLAKRRRQRSDPGPEGAGFPPGRRERGENSSRHPWLDCKAAPGSSADVDAHRVPSLCSELTVSVSVSEKC